MISQEYPVKIYWTVVLPGRVMFYLPSTVASGSAGMYAELIVN